MGGGARQGESPGGGGGGEGSQPVLRAAGGGASRDRPELETVGRRAQGADAAGGDDRGGGGSGPRGISCSHSGRTHRMAARDRATQSPGSEHHGGSEATGPAPQGDKTGGDRAP